MYNPYNRVLDPKVMFSKLRVQLLSKAPFFGALAMRLQPEPSNSIEVMATDGEKLYYNEQALLNFDRFELIGVVAHEVLHVMLGHHERREGRDHKAWNIACDYAINSILLDSGFVLPKERHYDRSYRGLAAEEIYARMLKEDGGSGGQQQPQQQGQQPQQGQQQGPQGQQQPQQGQQGPAGQDPQAIPAEDWGQVLDKKSQASAQSSSKAWQAAAVQLQRNRQAAGNTPGSLKAVLSELLRPKIPWQQLLRDFLTGSSRDDFSWARPNRRYISQGLYLPEARSEAIDFAVFAIDSSGSIDNKMLQLFLAEFNSIFQEVSYDLVLAMSCDTQIHPIGEFHQGQPVEIKEVKGRGGTSFKPVFKAVEKYGRVPDCLVYFTDLGVKEFPKDPGYPVLWVEPKKNRKSRWRKEPPYGTVLQVE